MFRLHQILESHGIPWILRICIFKNCCIIIYLCQHYLVLEKEKIILYDSVIITIISANRYFIQKSPSKLLLPVSWYHSCLILNRISHVQIPSHFSCLLTKWLIATLIIIHSATQSFLTVKEVSSANFGQLGGQAVRALAFRSTGSRFYRWNASDTWSWLGVCSGL